MRKRVYKYNMTANPILLQFIFEMLWQIYTYTGYLFC